MDPIASLWDPSGAQVANNDDGAVAACPGPYGDPVFSYMPTLTGVFTFQVAGYFDQPCPNGDWDFEIIFTDNIPEDFDLRDSWALANENEKRYFIDGDNWRLHPNLDLDGNDAAGTYTVEVPAGPGYDSPDFTHAHEHFEIWVDGDYAEAGGITGVDLFSACPSRKNDPGNSPRIIGTTENGSTPLDLPGINLLGHGFGELVHLNGDPLLEPGGTEANRLAFSLSDDAFTENSDLFFMTNGDTGYIKFCAVFALQSPDMLSGEVTSGNPTDYSNDVNYRELAVLIAVNFDGGFPGTGEIVQVRTQPARIDTGSDLDGITYTVEAQLCPASEPAGGAFISGTSFLRFSIIHITTSV